MWNVNHNDTYTEHNEGVLINKMWNVNHGETHTQHMIQMLIHKIRNLKHKSIKKSLTNAQYIKIS